MDKLERYPDIRIVPAEQIWLHEHHDTQRTAPLKERIATSGVLYNPPLVIPISPDNDRFMVLDGANRVTSMKELGLPALLVQVVDPSSPGLRLQTWNHVIWNTSQAELTAVIENLEGLQMFKSHKAPFEPGDVALVQFADNGIYRLSAGRASDRSDFITQLVKLYGEMARFDRTMIEDIEHLDTFYENLAGLMIYPHFRVGEVIDFAKSGRLLPAGVTRFIVSPRALRLNYPIANLAGPERLEEKQQMLRAFIQERMDKKGVRIYTETTVLYDE